MTNEQKLWTFAAYALTAGNRIALMAVAADEKGSPGKRGFKLALSSDGTSCGTIGGGIMEHRMMEQYAERLRAGGEVRDVRLLVHSPETKRGEPSGLSCAGSQTVCIVSLGITDLPAVSAVQRALADGTPARIVLSERGLAVSEDGAQSPPSFEQASPNTWTYAEHTGPEYTAIIIGGGHVGHALSRILSTLPMSVVVFDPRTEMPMFRDNPYAHRKISDTYANIAAYITAPEKTFAAVVTSDFVTDAEAVRGLLRMPLAYLGIMGVEAKVARIKNTLNDEERSLFEGREIHAPIGLPIGSSTAEEIAVSIAAEIIAVKNRLAAH